MDISSLLGNLTQSVVVVGGINYVIPKVFDWIQPAPGLPATLVSLVVISLSIWLGGIIARAFFR